MGTHTNTLKIVGKVERADGKKLSYREFWETYMSKNKPVLLTGLMDDWRACHDWVSSDGTPNLSFFSQHCAGSRVQVADCNKVVFGDQKRLEMTIAEYVDYWHRLSGDPSDLHGNENGENVTALLYLKDWHFVKEYPNYNAYTTPKFFSDDWLNLYLDNFNIHGVRIVENDKRDASCSDYRFVYMGPKGTWTPLHADVFRSYSWSANIYGRKLWHMLSPSQSHLLHDRYMKRTVYNIYDAVSKEQFPGFSKTCWIECIQEEHEILFVPSGWFHQVTNLEDTISVNHNWFNACNIRSVWELLVNDYNETKRYIEDIRSISEDFESLCQRNLAANTGMNFDDYFILLSRMAVANSVLLLDFLKLWEKQDSKINAEIPELESSQQLLFSLQSACNIALDMTCLDYFKSYRTCLRIQRDHISALSHQIKTQLISKIHCENTSNVRSLSSFDVSANESRELSTSSSSFEEMSILKNTLKGSLEQKGFQLSHNIPEDFLSCEDFELAIYNPYCLVQMVENVISFLSEKFSKQGILIP